MALLAIAIVTIIFAISMIRKAINFSEFAKKHGCVASLLLTISVVMMMACFDDVTREQSKIFGLLALVSSIIYAPFCISTYFLQTSTVSLNPLNLSSEVLEAINFKPGSPIFVHDIIDGAPVARFTQRLKKLIEKGYVPDDHEKPPPAARRIA